MGVKIVANISGCQRERAKCRRFSYKEGRLQRLLYGDGPADPITFAAMSIVIALVTWVSVYVPAGRATRVDPAIVLRGDQAAGARASRGERMVSLRNPYSARRTNIPAAACRSQGRVPLRSLHMTRSVTLPGFRRLRNVCPSHARAARSEGFLRETIRSRNVSATGRVNAGAPD
jgi:hypothetical protein